MAYESDLNLKATELTLGLPGCDELKKQATPIRTNKRPLPERSEESRTQDHSRASNAENDDADTAPPAKAQIVGWPPIRSYRKNCLQANKHETDGTVMYVKVSVDGAPYLRKIDLKVYKNYPELLKGLENLFKLTIGEYNVSDYAPIYEDKDGDWMLVGDVPWNMFISSCKRLRIMKRTETRRSGCL